MLDQYLNSNNINTENQNINQGGENEEEDDNCTNEKYIMSENDFENQQSHPPKNLRSIQPLDTLISSNRINPSENMPLKLNDDNTIPSSLKNNYNTDSNNQIINNMVINSTPSHRSTNSNNNSIDNYMKMENLYLQDGKCNTTQSNNNNMDNDEVTTSNKENSRLRNLEFLSRNEQQIKQLQEKTQPNITTQQNNDNENYNNNINNNNMNKTEKENEKMDSFITECKQKIRNEKEQKLRQKVIEGLRPKIQNEIYKKEYNNIVAEIKQQIEYELNEEITKKNNEEISTLKKKQSYVQKMREEEIEKEIRLRCQEELEDELNRELLLKQKEMTLKYMQKYEAYKKKLDKELSEDFETKRKEMVKEIDDIKSKIYRSKCSENLKINKINTMKKNIKTYHEKNLKGAEQVEKIINNNEIEDNEEEDMNNYQYNDENKNNNNHSNYQDLIKTGDYLVDMYKNNVQNSSVNLSKQKSKDKMNTSSNTTKIKNDPHNNREMYMRVDNSVNLFEINKKIKAVNGNSNQNESFRSLKPPANLIQSSSPLSPICSDPQGIIKTSGEFQKKTETDKTNPQPNIRAINNAKQVSNQNYINKVPSTPQSPPKNIFYSLQLDKSIPTTVSEFGKYLLSHIEKEENYKMLFLSEVKKLKNQILKIFRNEKSTDHCLTDYMIELWDKLEISYTTRYQILKNLLKLKSLQLYSFLDKETEYLTEYYQITEEIFKMIKQRESIKSKLQTKLNRNELLPDDKNGFDDISKEVADKIKAFKNKYKNLDIIWKGLRYEWFMNYENWFYGMNQVKN